MTIYRYTAKAVLAAVAVALLALLKNGANGTDWWGCCAGLGGSTGRP